MLETPSEFMCTDWELIITENTAVFSMFVLWNQLDLGKIIPLYVKPLTK